MEYSLVLACLFGLSTAIMINLMCFDEEAIQISFRTEFDFSKINQTLFLIPVFCASAFLGLDIVQTLLFLWVLSVLLILSIIDAETQIIPDVFSFTLIWTGLLASSLSLTIKPELSIVGAISGYLSLWVLYHVYLYILKTETMGYGDFKLLAGIGAWTGPFVLPWVIAIAGIIALIYIAFKKIKEPSFKGQIAYGPFLSIGGIVMLLAVFLESPFAMVNQ